MSEVKRYDPINSDGTCGICIEDAGYGAYVEYADYAALEAELAKLRAGQESLLLNLAEQKRQAVEYREMWAKAAERAFAQSSDLSFLAEYIVGREYGTEQPNYEALGRYPLDVAEAAIAAARKGEV